MDGVFESLLWTSLFLVTYTFCGYPLLLAVWSWLKPRALITRAPITHAVSIVISAWNEAPRLVARINNCLEQRYPGVLCKGHPVRYAWIEVQRKDYTLDEMCTVLAVSVSGYRTWKQGGTSGRTRLTHAQMLTWIRAIHDELKGAYGSPRMVRELCGRGVLASKERAEVWRLMDFFAKTMNYSG